MDTSQIQKAVKRDGGMQSRGSKVTSLMRKAWSKFELEDECGRRERFPIFKLKKYI